MSEIPWMGLLAATSMRRQGSFVVRCDPADDRQLLAALTGSGPAGSMKGMGKTSKLSREQSPRYERTKHGTMRLKRRKRRGFTLPELLVVIAIVGVLLGILLPALSRARDAGRDAACLAHLRGVGQLVHAYGEAFGSFPAPDGPARYGTPWWLTAIGCEHAAATCPRDRHGYAIDYVYPAEHYGSLDRLWRDHADGSATVNLRVVGDREAWHDGKVSALVLGRQLDAPVLAAWGAW